MNCYYHPEREPVGACVNCGQMVCAECRVTLAGKVYCNPCADALVTGPATSTGSSWFQRHLNWTMVLAWPAVFAVAFMLGMVVGAIDPYVSSTEIEGMGALTGLVVLSLIWGWALRQKNRSLWWLLLGLFVPFGFIVILCLENKSESKQVSAP